MTDVILRFRINSPRTPGFWLSRSIVRSGLRPQSCSHWWVLCCGHPPSHHLRLMGVKLIFNMGHISLVVAFKGLNVILGLYKCNYSLTRGKEVGTATG